MKRTIKYLLMVSLGLFLWTQVFGERYVGAPSMKPASNDIKGFAAACALGRTITEISLNNVRTFVFMTGLLWTDIGGGTSGYEVPKGSGKTALYAGGIWIGGTDVNGQLKLTAVKFVGARNYWPGPLIMTGELRGTTDVEVCYQYDRHYEITKYQVEAFREWYNTPPEEREKEFSGYSIPQIILDWPAHPMPLPGMIFTWRPTGTITMTAFTILPTETTHSTTSTGSCPAARAAS